jgi:hypothetical protein
MRFAPLLSVSRNETSNYEHRRLDIWLNLRWFWCLSEGNRKMIAAISPAFGYDVNADRFCLTSQCQHSLQALGARLTLTGDGPATELVAIYVTESPEPDYDAFGPSAHGRIVALVRPLPMPAGLTIWAFPSGCLELKGGQLVDRWPVGWPCEVVFYSPCGGPVLRHVFAAALGRYDYFGLTHGLLQGPIELSVPWRRPLEPWLMREIRYQVARDPGTQIRPF